MIDHLRWARSLSSSALRCCAASSALARAVRSCHHNARLTSATMLCTSWKAQAVSRCMHSQINNQTNRGATLAGQGSKTFIALSTEVSESTMRQGVAVPFRRGQVAKVAKVQL